MIQLLLIIAALIVAGIAYMRLFYKPKIKLTEKQ